MEQDKEKVLKKEIFKVLTEVLYKTQRINKLEKDRIYKNIK